MHQVLRSTAFVWMLAVGSVGVAFGAGVHVSTDAINAGLRDNPRVAYNSLHDEYLVIWQNDTSHGIYGQRVSPTGTLLGSWICISCGSDVINPDITYSRTSDSYLVVWQYDNGDGYHLEIHGRIIDRFGENGLRSV